MITRASQHCSIPSAAGFLRPLTQLEASPLPVTNWRNANANAATKVPGGLRLRKRSTALQRFLPSDIGR
jgi:hypothetical protein